MIITIELKVIFNFRYISKELKLNTNKQSDINNAANTLKFNILGIINNEYQKQVNDNWKSRKP